MTFLRKGGGQKKESALSGEVGSRGPLKCEEGKGASQKKDDALTRKEGLRVPRTRVGKKEKNRDRTNGGVGKDKEL